MMVTLNGNATVEHFQILAMVIMKVTFLSRVGVAGTLHFYSEGTILNLGYPDS
jgi:hypothetical protein